MRTARASLWSLWEKAAMPLPCGGLGAGPTCADSKLRTALGVAAGLSLARAAFNGPWSLTPLCALSEHQVSSPARPPGRRAGGQETRTWSAERESHGAVSGGGEFRARAPARRTGAESSVRRRRRTARLRGERRGCDAGGLDGNACVRWLGACIGVPLGQRGPDDTSLVAIVSGLVQLCRSVAAGSGRRQRAPIQSSERLWA